MTNPNHTDTSRSDHARGCEGRNYSCTCGYDDAIAARIEALEAENERLRELLDAWLGLAREHLDTELAGRTFAALERTRK